MKQLIQDITETTIAAISQKVIEINISLFGTGFFAIVAHLNTLEQLARILCYSAGGFLSLFGIINVIIGWIKLWKGRNK